MNGEELKYLKEIGLERHAENLVKFEKIFTRIDALNCKAQFEKISNSEKRIDKLEHYFIWVIVIGVVFGLWIKLVLAG